MKITKLDMLKTLEVKKIISNILTYFIILVVVDAVLILLKVSNVLNTLLFIILIYCITLFFLLIIFYTQLRYRKLVYHFDEFETHVVKLDKVVWYMNDKVPVFSIKIERKGGFVISETNAIYTKESIKEYQNKDAVVLYDEDKNRCYIVKTIDKKEENNK